MNLSILISNYKPMCDTIIVTNSVHYSRDIYKLKLFCMKLKIKIVFDTNNYTPDKKTCLSFNFIRIFSNILIK